MGPLFKSPKQAADDDFAKAYSKGVKLGREKWLDASNYFGSAASRYNQLGMRDRATLSAGLSFLFKAAVTNDPDFWRMAYENFSNLGEIPVDIGSVVSAQDIAEECRVVYLRNKADSKIASKAVDSVTVMMLEDVAKACMGLIGRDLVVWKQLGVSGDPQVLAYSYLAVARQAEGRMLEGEDPEKAIYSYNQARQYVQLAKNDMFGVGPDVNLLLDKLGKVAKCWFCGRTVQGKGVHFVELPASTTKYMIKKYGSEANAMTDNVVYACISCYLAIHNEADNIARRYYARTMAEIDALKAEIARIDERIRLSESAARNAR